MDPTQYSCKSSGTIVEDLTSLIAAGKSIEECREDLIEVIEEWVAVWLVRGLDTCPGRPYNWAHAGADGCHPELFPFLIEFA
jgi:hypothetical protein